MDSLLQLEGRWPMGGKQSMVKYMKWNILMIFLYIALNISSQSASGQELDLETLIAGTKYYDSLVKSGTGTVVYEFLLTFRDKSKRRPEKMVYTFTFEGKRKIRADFQKCFLYNNQTHIWDGEKTIIYERGTNRYVKADSCSLSGEEDPRSWITMGPYGEYRDNPLGKYLEKHIKEIKILRTEKVDGILCYVLKVHGKFTIWIAPEMGFRMIKLYCTARIRGINTEFKRRIYYKEYKFNDITVWFLKRMEREINKMTSKGKVTGPEAFYVKDDFKLNVDVSGKFKLPPNIKVFNPSSGRYTIIK